MSVDMVVASNIWLMSFFVSRSYKHRVGCLQNVSGLGLD